MPLPRILSGDQGNAQPQGGSFFSKIPTWVWYGVGIVGGLVIFMMIRGKAGTSTSPIQLGSAGTAGADSGMLGAPPATSTLGITSPNGSSINLGNVALQPTDIATIIKSIFPGPADPTTNGATGGNPAPTPAPSPSPAPSPGPPSNTPAFAQFISVGKWPDWNGSLSGIASHYGLSLQQVENLNPQLKRGTHNWNLIYPGEQVRLY